MADKDSEIDLRLARSYIAEAIKNAHAAIRSSWTIMFTAGTFGALSTINAVLRCKHSWYIPHIISYPTPPNACHYDDTLVNYMMGLIVYFLTFSRFYLGDCRVFDIKYSEIFSLIVNETNSRSGRGPEERFERIMRYNDRKFFKFEFIWMLFQTLVVIFLAFQIDNAEFFVEVYILLLVSNSVWLYVSVFQGEPTITNTVSEALPYMHLAVPSRGRIRAKLRLPREAARVWIINNLVHATILCLIVIFSPMLGPAFSVSDVYLQTWSFSMTIAMMVCLSNCLVDFKLSHNFYFPKFFDDYEVMYHTIKTQSESESESKPT